MSATKQIFSHRVRRITPIAVTITVLCACFSVSLAQEEGHPDSVIVDSMLAVQQPMGGMMAPMALPSPPNISYSVPSTLQVGVSVSYAPTNTGGAVYADWDLTDFVGSGAQGYVNGTDASAVFHYPSGIVSDGSGTLYVAEGRNHVIRKVTSAGVVTTFAGSGTAGSANGTGTAASFNYPMGLALDGSGNLYVVDRNNHRIRKITPAGVVTTLAGSTQGFANGTGTAARFNAPADIALDAAGNAYVTDEQNHRLRKITPAGVVTTLAGSGTQGNANGTGTAAQFNVPQGLSIDGSGNLYVGDQVGNQIRKVTPAGVVTSFATNVTRPISLERDASGDLYAGLLGHRLARISTAGTVTIVAGTGVAGTENGPPLSAQLNFPGGIAFDPQGNRFIADMWNNKVRRMGTGQGYAISPALPAGMTFNRTTGVIGGTPTATSPSTTYTVTARNAGGSFPRTVTFSVGAGAFSSNWNYILKTTYLGRYTSVQADPPIDSAMRDITYFDGLGRPVQEVGVKATPNKDKDVVTPIAYDGFGRQDRDYLPYATATGLGGAFKSNAVTQQAGYYSSATTVPAGQSATSHAFSQRKYEASPLNRVLEQGFPGAAWQPATTRGTTGRTVATEYATNNALALSDSTTRRALRYGVTLNTAGVPTLTVNGVYPTGELYVTVAKGENWIAGRLHTTEEYTDKQGRVVLRRTFTTATGAAGILSTYYVYNDLGQLSFVLPPGRDAEFNPDSGSLPTPAAMNNFAYQYRYDRWGRMSYRRLPGGGAWENYNYSKVGWLVFHQDSRQQLETYAGLTPGHYHTFHKYDGQGRVVMKGIERGRGANTREEIEGYLQGHFYQWEARSDAPGNLEGYTNNSIPQNSSNFDILEVNYYDRYTGIPDLPHNQSGSYSGMTHGKLVASKVKVLGTADYLWTVYYYDNKGNLVREWKQHYLGGTKSATKFDDILREYTFSGQLKKETRKHHRTNDINTEVTVLTEYDYDHRGRQTHTWKTVNPVPANPEYGRTLIARNTLNEVGQLRVKNLHSTNSGTSFGQAITYGYNERGWLRSASGGLFRQTLRYADTAANPQYNGNIAHQVFSRRGMTGTPPAWLTETYSYRYDGANRLIQGAMGTAGQKGRETLTYDRNGNIRSLQRTDAAGALVDRLRYDYMDGTTSWGNRLRAVHDSVTTTVAGDPYQLPGLTQYTYDANGNVKTRQNTNATHNTNNITATTYNYFNLPQAVTANGTTVSYVYDGRGRKLRSVNGVGTQTRDYVDGIEYVGGSTMELIHHEEGRIVRSGSTYEYDYFIRDHLGNNRTGFRQGTSVTTPNFTTDYYPFGMQYVESTFSRPGSPKNQYLYNGKELQDRLKQLDYGARLYDPVIGRWGAVDPLAEQFDDVSPYNYGLNNPLRFVDPTGMAALDTTLLQEVVIWAKKTFKETDWSDALGNFVSGGQVDDMEYSLHLYETEGLNSYLYSQIGSANRDARFSMMGQYRGGRGPFKQGKLRILGSGFSSSERKAAEYLKKKGYNVVLREPKGRRGEGGTSDLLVNGKTYDVYTPKTNNPNSIVSAMAKKNEQAQGIVLDLSNTGVTSEQLGDVLKRVNNAGATKIKDIIILPK